MDITTVLAVISSAIVFLAWFVLPSKLEAPSAKPDVMPDLGVTELAA
jgi:hypothetical protein